jgi:dienelactone hydrolase
MPRRMVMTWLILGTIVAGSATAAYQSTYRTLDDRFSPPRYSSLDSWTERARTLRAHVLASAGLVPLPEKSALNPVIFGDVAHADYTVSKVYFESLPGFFVTGNLYRPIGNGPFPAVLSPHGHWTYGRLENSATTSGPARAIGLARLGFVVFAYDMIGYLDSQQLTHTFGGRREQLWGLTLAGLQLWNGIRAIDFLETLPYVKRDAIGATGESGGGTQTFLLAAVDPRIAVAAPVNMISLHMQGGCLCENLPGLRLDTNNVEIAATIAPRPLLMVSATGDWTKETMEVEYPAVRSIYQLAGAGDRVHAVRIDAEHNYNKASREAMYAWMMRWLARAPSDVRVEEKGFSVEPLQNLLVFYQRPRPGNAVTQAQLTEQWIAAAKRQLTSTDLDTRLTALRDSLGFSPSGGPPTFDRADEKRPPVLLDAPDAELERELRRKGLRTVLIPFTPFDEPAAAKIRHFETYNRTPASQRVADIVAAIHKYPESVLVAKGEAALAGVLAMAVARPRIAILDVETFDTSSDDDFVRRLFIPGVRRGGDLQTAGGFLPDGSVIHNAGTRFAIDGVKVRAARLTPREIAAAITARAVTR